MNNDKINLMILGDFTFSIGTIPYEKLEKQSEYIWASHKPVGADHEYQSLGNGEKQITLSGTLYHEITGGQITFIIGSNGEQYTTSEGAGLTLEPIEVMAERGESYTLVNGRGFNLGFWIITSITETSTAFFQDGTPRKIEFSLVLKRAKPNKPQQTATIDNGSDFNNFA